jgi:hypothetical protein
MITTESTFGECLSIIGRGTFGILGSIVSRHSAEWDSVVGTCRDVSAILGAIVALLMAASLAWTLIDKIRGRK